MEYDWPVGTQGTSQTPGTEARNLGRGRSRGGQRSIAGAAEARRGNRLCRQRGPYIRGADMTAPHVRSADTRAQHARTQSDRLPVSHETF